MAARIEVMVVGTDVSDLSVIGSKGLENTGKYDVLNGPWHHQTCV